MANAKKRSRSRQSSASRPRSYSQIYKDSTTADTADAPPQGDSIPRATVKGQDSVDWKSEYSYVFKDLRTLVIVTVIIFVLMIGAGLLF